MFAEMPSKIRRKMDIKTHSKNVKSPILFSCFLAAFSMAVSSCGSKSTIELQKPIVAPAPSVPNEQKTGPGTNPDDPSLHPEKPDVPVPTGSNSNRYRLICEGAPAQITPFLTLETTTESFEAALIISLGSFNDPNEAVTETNKNIVEGSSPVVLPMPETGRIDYLFTGRKQISRGVYSDLRLFQADVDTTYRTGAAADLGAAPTIAKMVRLAADALGITPANYGSSDQGHFVLIPVGSGSGAGFEILSRDRVKSFGRIKADPSKTILPKIFENQKTFSALVFNGTGFTPVMKKLSISSSSVSVTQSLNLGTPNGTALSIQTFNSKELAWSESQSAHSNAITFAKVDTSTGQVTRATYKSNVSNAKIFPQMVVINDDGGSDRTVNIAVEAVLNTPANPAPGATVTYAKIQKLILSQDGLSLREGDTLDYPASSLARVRTYGLRGQWIIGTLLTTENSDELIGTFDGASTNGYQLFKDRGGFLDGVSQAACGHPAISEVKL
jgi:hypothetical protein